MRSEAEIRAALADLEWLVAFVASTHGPESRAWTCARTARDTLLWVLGADGDGEALGTVLDATRNMRTRRGLEA